MRLSNKAELLMAEFEVIIRSSFVLVSVIYIEITKIAAGFLANLDKYLHNSPFYYDCNM